MEIVEGVRPSAFWQLAVKVEPLTLIFLQV